MGRSWNERSTYGNIIKNLISRQIAKYEKERDKIDATKIAQNIGYLIQVQSGLIKDEDSVSLVKRIEELEKKAGI